MAHAREELTLRRIRGLGDFSRTQEFGDVVIESHHPDAFAVHHNGHREHLDVDKGAVLAAPFAEPLHHLILRRLHRK